MKTSTLLSALATLFLSISSVAGQDSNATQVIVSNAQADNIDLSVFPNLESALADIAAVYTDAGAVPEVRKRSAPENIIDVHGHIVPSWYKAMVPTTGGNPTPDWDLNSHLSFMASEGISRSIIAFSTPNANVYLGQKGLTVALARLMNEQAAAYCLVYPSKFSFFAVVPLPYTNEAITEAKYAIEVLGAVGIALQSNFEGLYLGNVQFKPFFDAINKLGSRQILYVHPGAPYIKVGNNLVEANPTPYPSGNVEFYFETARTIMDLTLSQTIQNYANIHYVIPHVGGAFPAAIDRILKSVPTIYDSSMQIYSTRFWWDSAGPTYFHQIAGLLGYNIPKSQLLFGTDYPYAPAFTQAGSLAAIGSSTLLSGAEKIAVFSGNVKNLFGNKIKW